jgi:CRP-like cAMP-binding protein
VERTTSRKERGTIRTDSTGRPVQNSILQSIPENEYDLIRGHLEFLDLPQRHILHEAGAKLEFAYFLNDGMASVVVLTSDGRSVEVAIVGKEGIVGTPLAVGLSRGPTAR